MPSSINFKDINLLTQKQSVAGTERLPVSDTEYITPIQIAALAGGGGGGGSNIIVEDASHIYYSNSQYSSLDGELDDIRDTIGDIETILASI